MHTDPYLDGILSARVVKTEPGRITLDMKNVGADSSYEGILIKNLALHQEVGGDLFAPFSSLGRQGQCWGSGGSSEYYGQPLSEIPKLRALVDSNPPKKS